MIYYICILHDKKVAANLISQKIKSKLTSSSLFTNSYEIIPALYKHNADNPSSSTVEILKIGHTSFETGIHEMSVFLEQLNAKENIEKKVLFIEANLGETAGKAVTQHAINIIDIIKPNALTLVAGDQCLESMRQFKQPTDCSSFEICTHATVLSSVSAYLNRLVADTEKPLQHHVDVNNSSNNDQDDYGYFVTESESESESDTGDATDNIKNTPEILPESINSLVALVDTNDTRTAIETSFNVTDRSDESKRNSLCSRLTQFTITPFNTVFRPATNHQNRRVIHPINV